MSNQGKLRHQLRHPGRALDLKAKDLIGHLWVSLIIDQSECLVCFLFLHWIKCFKQKNNQTNSTNQNGYYYDWNGLISINATRGEYSSWASALRLKQKIFRSLISLCLVLLTMHSKYRILTSVFILSKNTAEQTGYLRNIKNTVMPSNTLNSLTVHWLKHSYSTYGWNNKFLPLSIQNTVNAIQVRCTCAFDHKLPKKR